MEMGQREPALQDYTKAIELQPGYVLAYINRAGCLYLLHHYDQAWEDLQMCRKYGVTAPPELVQKVAHAMGRSSR
jgi:tetratricopeptide (TPR) repeat protein